MQYYYDQAGLSGSGGAGTASNPSGNGTYVAEVDEDDRDRHRFEAVVTAFEAAVDAALRVQCTTAEMEKILQQVIAKRNEQKKPGGS